MYKDHTVRLILLVLFVSSTLCASRDREPYEILGVSKDASSATIKKAHRRLARIYHPDKNRHKTPEQQEAAKQKMQEINDAYEKMTNKNNAEPSLEKRWGNQKWVPFGLKAFLATCYPQTTSVTSSTVAWFIKHHDEIKEIIESHGQTPKKLTTFLRRELYHILDEYAPILVLDIWKHLMRPVIKTDLNRMNQYGGVKYTMELTKKNVAKLGLETLITLSSWLYSYSKHEPHLARSVAHYLVEHAHEFTKHVTRIREEMPRGILHGKSEVLNPECYVKFKKFLQQGYDTTKKTLKENLKSLMTGESIDIHWKARLTMFSGSALGMASSYLLDRYLDI